jgi:hypothetical protein
VQNESLEIHNELLKAELHDKENANTKLNARLCALEVGKF